MSEYSKCILCKRSCGINRETGLSGFCGAASSVTMAWAGLHFGEEPPLTGKTGSGALFFSGCTLQCPFCQNWQISHDGMGKVIDKETFIGICTELVERGAVNLNFITGSHFTPTLIDWMGELKVRGVPVPLMWNSSGFDSLGNLKKLSEVVDIFLPDLKTLNTSLSRKLFKTDKYPETVQEGLLFVMSEKPLILDKKGLMKQGVIIRHLVMPGLLENTREVLTWFSGNKKPGIFLSIMSQYTPVSIPGNKTEIPERYITKTEYDEIITMLEELEIENGFIQEFATGTDWLPDFSRKTPFYSNNATTVWSFSEGYL
ncbi:MAG: radical SAM protein [Spirochaetes bacterium]|nr:MAG: radical SAM protein [Spirochaetota bacterium]